MSDNHPNPSEARAQLSKVLAGTAFRESDRHRRLLEFLVETTLRGEADGLKEFVIAAAVWGRDVSFDPRIHSTVRVEIGRLRTRLRQYYAGEGAGDPIRFRIPTGGYAAVIERAVAEAVPASGRDSHFEIVELIGRGGMGEVWKARDRRLGRDVALKFISKDLAGNGAARQTFEREARAAAALNHPNICTVYDVGENDGQPFLAMELLEGETLEQRLIRKDVPVEALVGWGIEIADALEAAHGRGIVHSDLKPANLFLTTRGQTKILDFGLARLIGEAHEGANAKAAPAGTFGYMSPEQAKGEALDPRSDIYSLGIVLYRAATGRVPEPSSGPPSSHNPSVPPDLDRIIAKALEGDREIRYQHASELRADLKRLKRDSDAELLRPPPILAKTNQRGYLWAAIAAVAGIAVAGVALYWHLRAASRMPFRDAAITRMTDSEDVQLTAISPDGNYLATVRKDAQGKQSLWLRHLPSNTDRRLLENAAFSYNSIRLSPDSSFVYFRGALKGGTSPHDVHESDLYRVPVIGGDAALVVRNVDSQVAFVGDGRRLCFYRGDTDHNVYSFIGASAEGGEEQVLGKAADIPSATACSPDGKRAALSFHSDEILVEDFATGKSRVLYRPANDRWLVYGITWTPDGRGMIVSTADKGKFLLQLGYVAYPSGQFHPITNSLNTYSHGVSLTADGTTLAATEGRPESTLYTAALSAPTKLEKFPLRGMDSFAWLTDHRIAAVGDDGAPKLVDLDAQQAVALRVPQGYFFANPGKCGEDAIVAEGGSREQPGQGIFRIGLDGNSFQRLTHGKRDLAPQCTQDARWLVYVDNENMRSPALTAVPLAGGTARQIADRCTWFGLSPDGKLLAALVHGEGAHIVLMTVGSWQQTRRVELPSASQRPVSFDAGNGLLLADYAAGAGSVSRLPLGGSRASPLLSVPGQQIQDLRMSPGGSRLAFVAHSTPADAVIFRERQR